MIITLDQLLNGKATKIKGKDYFSTEQYVTPFLERMSPITSDFRIEVKVPDQITKTQTGEINLEDITYNRVLIQAVLPEEFAYDNHDEVIGFLYGLDTRKPIVKIYRSGLNRACTNLCVFDPSFLNVQNLEPEKAINYKPVNYLLDQTSDIKSGIRKMKEIYIPGDDTPLINEHVGMWLRNTMNKSYNAGYGTVKLASSTVVDAVKLLFDDTESNYYHSSGDDICMFDVYNAFTDIISNDKGKDLMNKIEKVLLLKSILNLD